jgi:hypothetical protein
MSGVTPETAIVSVATDEAFTDGQEALTSAFTIGALPLTLKAIAINLLELV